MADYTSREAILNIFQVWRSDLTQQIEENIAFPHTRSDLKVCRTQLDDCIHAVREIPAADVRPVVHGEWIEHISDLFPADSTIECDQCHAEQPAGIDDNFCPNCGADMRGK